MASVAAPHPYPGQADVDQAAAKDLFAASPMTDIERPDEILAFRSKLETADMADPTKLALQLLLVMG